MQPSWRRLLHWQPNCLLAIDWKDVYVAAESPLPCAILVDAVGVRRFRRYCGVQFRDAKRADYVDSQKDKWHRKKAGEGSQQG
jgi:hypothetical protein